MCFTCNCLWHMIDCNLGVGETPFGVSTDSEPEAAGRDAG